MYLMYLIYLIYMIYLIYLIYLIYMIYLIYSIYKKQTRSKLECHLNKSGSFESKTVRNPLKKPFFFLGRSGPPPLRTGLLVWMFFVRFGIFWIGLGVYVPPGPPNQAQKPKTCTFWGGGPGGGLVLRLSTVWYGMVWYGMVWYGMVWYGMVRLA